ncbi:MAG: hypothetical protein A2297_00365 [Elusimicrobia bacterium RIFOXYB2_FULL_48_7]|nr:MAG: hypothetical protein A2297_00365 [Elusimicrobia bacterium RIFOXYB2_FULL_48_7]
MRRKALIILLVGLPLMVFFSLPDLYAGNPGTAGLQFLQIAPGARPTGMGEAFCAISDDSNAIFWNPAGLSQIQKKEVSFLYNQWIENIQLSYLTLVIPFESNVIGISVEYLSIGDIQGRDEYGNTTNVFSPYDLSAGISFSKPVSSNMLLGAAFKAITEANDNVQSSGFAVDLSALYFCGIKKNIALGLNIQNLGPEMTYAHETVPLPLNIKIGASYKPNDTLALAYDINQPNDAGTKMNMGAELLSLKPLIIRAGYGIGYDLPASYAGIGLVLNNLKLDYGFRTTGSHQISLSASF